MLKTRRKETSEQLRFPEPREGLPEDPHPFLGSQHLVAAVAVQEHLSARCLVAVVGPAGSGKSTVCQRAANSRWARQWFLRDEAGHPVHRRFWVDLEDCQPGREVGERVAHALGRRSFASALSRLGDGRPCLLVLDNADQALVAGEEELSKLSRCVARGATIVVTARDLAGLDPGRPWTDVVEVSGFVSDDEAMDLFVSRAPQYAADPRVVALLSGCDRLPGAVALLAGAGAIGDLEEALAGADAWAEANAGAGANERGIAFALSTAAATVDEEDRLVWGALSLLPSGVGRDDVVAVLDGLPDAERRAIRLHLAGVAERCETGIRVPRPLRLAPPDAGLDEAAVAAVWARYARRAAEVVGPPPKQSAQDTLAPGGPVEPPRRATRTKAEARQARGASGEPWLVRQVSTLAALGIRPRLPPSAFDLACAGLLVHRSGSELDALDSVLVRFIEPFLLPPWVGGAVPSGAGDTGEQAADDHRANIVQAAQIAAVLEDQRRFAAAVEVAGQVVIAAGADGDALVTAAALCRLGRAERLAAQHALAANHLSEALRLYDACHDVVGRGSVLFELGQIDLDLGRLDDAEDKLEAARHCFADSGRPLGEANAELDLVRVDLARGRVEQAERRLNDAMDRYLEADDALGYANSCLQLGQVELARGRLDSAERRFRAALDNFERATDRVGFAHACLQLGQVELARGRLEHAERRFRGALAGYTAVDDKVGLANASLQLGQIDLAWGRLEQASLRLRDALASYEALGDQIGEAHACLQLGQVELGQGHLADAADYVERARSGYDATGDALGSANSRHVTALICQAEGDANEALYFFGEAARLYDLLGRTAAAGWSLAGAARVCTGRAERQAYAAGAVHHLEAADLGDAALRLAAELAELDVPPPAEPALGYDDTEEPAMEAEEPAEQGWAEGPSSHWPRVPTEEPVPNPPESPERPESDAAAAAGSALDAAQFAGALLGAHRLPEPAIDDAVESDPVLGADQARDSILDADLESERLLGAHRTRQSRRSQSIALGAPAPEEHSGPEVGVHEPVPAVATPDDHVVDEGDVFVQQPVEDFGAGGEDSAPRRLRRRWGRRPLPNDEE